MSGDVGRRVYVYYVVFWFMECYYFDWINVIVERCWIGFFNCDEVYDGVFVFVNVSICLGLGWCGRFFVFNWMFYSIFWCVLYEYCGVGVVYVICWKWMGCVVVYLDNCL